MGQNGSDGPRLLSGGNPQIAKAYSEAPVQAWIAALPGWKASLGARIDQVITDNVPGVLKAVKWNSPLYGTDGVRWFVALRCYTKYLQIAFFRGQSLRPIPPKASKSGDTRYFDIFEDQPLDLAQFADWVRQASLLPGEKL